MKNNIILFIFALSSITAYGQLNEVGSNVGIGTPNPTHKLDVATSTDNIMKVTAKGIGWGGVSLFEVYSERNTAGSNPLIHAGSAYSPYAFCVTSSGNVGIGTNTPNSKLQIGNKGGSDKNINIPGTYNFEQINLNMGGNGNGQLEFVTHTAVSTSGGVKLYNADGAHLYFQTSSSADSYNNLNYQTKMVLANSGNVGIGTVTPAAKLDIYEPTILGANLNNSILLQRISGRADNKVMQNLWLTRDNNGSNWYTARIHNGISIDGSYLKPATDTRTWWERDPYNVIQSWGNGSDTFMTLNNGNLGIGTTTPPAGYKLAVAGKIIAEEIQVKLQSNWPDYVFSPTYNLPTLSEVEQFIKTNQHLPEVPSAQTVEQDGISVGEMNAVLLKKIEELTLYTIGQGKALDKQEKEIDRLQTLEIELKEIKEIINQLNK